MQISNGEKLIDQFRLDADKGILHCEGHWDIHHITTIRSLVEKKQLPKHTNIILSGEKLLSLDSAGALYIQQLVEQLEQDKNQVTFHHFKKSHQGMIARIDAKKEFIRYAPTPPKKTSLLYKIGEQAVLKLNQGLFLLKMLGSISNIFFKACKNFRRFHLPSIIQTIYDTGVTALPIIALLSFLIGVVLAYQMGLQLETYGANIFIAFLSGMAIFREFSPLITAIIVAGRTSSAFTAHLGSMKINEEIDALYTMGLSPVELLVLPKVLGLLIVFPLLIFWSVLFATLGAMVMSKFMLEVSFIDFLSRLQKSVGIQQFMLGLYKAPVFAGLIGIVGCVQGLMVQSNADSIGKQTTKSVVQALFLIIVADAVYSIIYSWLNL